ncbi:hypothetical protein [Novosphingobium album (ex Liu et al. 2023)]|uniref:Uncharacterized protein n=1 Tax=Novosphingobium album (ex Liu et al. 2023) TaxID=3031130 RepID=A0ABT5WS37_9SPHN|nr:hypothetical protein [Novosphingobium album (ex Liu et al. 2023)]MDE8652864.1 hypothetical protein [Novosphingobium album (ex Liu et al. 2023)]
MRIVKFDLNTYNLTKDLPGGATYGVVEEEVPEIEMITDENGNPTRGGLIGYALAYALLAGFVGAMFYFL